MRLAAGLGERVRLGAEVRRVSVAPSGCRVALASGEEVAAETIVCALPVGVIHGLEVDGVDPERLASLRRQRMALSAKAVAVYPRAFWSDLGASGLAEGEHVLGSTWPQETACSRSSSRPTASVTFSPSRRITPSVHRRRGTICTRRRRMRHLERPWQAVCGKSACTVRTGVLSTARARAV